MKLELTNQFSRPLTRRLIEALCVNEEMSDDRYLLNGRTKIYVGIGSMNILQNDDAPFERSKFGLKVPPKLVSDYLELDLPGEIKTFLEQNKTETELLVGGEPWERDTEDSYTWKEHVGPFTMELWLPRNLINDLGIYNWKEAQSHLKNCEIHRYGELNEAVYIQVFQNYAKST